MMTVSRKTLEDMQLRILEDLQELPLTEIERLFKEQELRLVCLSLAVLPWEEQVDQVETYRDDEPDGGSGTTKN